MWLTEVTGARRTFTIDLRAGHPYLPTSPHISLTLLYWRIQPGRCVFAFGGWAVGRAVHLSQDLLDLQVEIEMD